MDPLSVTASVIALLGAGGRIISILSQVAAISDAPALATVTLTEMTDISTALQHIRDFVNGAVKVSAELQRHILLEHLVATLTGCLTTYSELDAITDGLKIGSSGMSVSDRVKWTIKEASISAVVRRLQNHKSSLNLMLSILQSTSIIEIHQTVTRLHGLMEQLLCSDDDLYRRLSSLKGARSPPSGVSNMETIVSDSADDNGHNATIRPVMMTKKDTMHDMMGFTFNSVLANSRIHSGFKSLRSKTHSQTPVASSTRRKMAISVFSATSLADISNISVYSLPICAQEVGNSNWFAATQAPSVPSSPTRTLGGMMQDLKKILSFKTSIERERVVSDLAPKRATTDRPRTSNNRPSTGNNRPSTGNNRPSTGNKRPSTGNKRPSTGNNRPSTGNKRPSTGNNRPSTPTRNRRPSSRGNRPRPQVYIVEYHETEDRDIIQGIQILYTLIDQHAEKIYSSETNYVRRIIGETFSRWISSTDNDGMIPRIFPNSPLSKLGNSECHISVSKKDHYGLLLGSYGSRLSCASRANIQNGG